MLIHRRAREACFRGTFNTHPNIGHVVGGPKFGDAVEGSGLEGLDSGDGVAEEFHFNVLGHAGAEERFVIVVEG